MEQATPLIQKTRSKQIATLNDDKMNAPAKQGIRFHIELLFIAILHAVGFYCGYQYFINGNAQVSYLIFFVLLSVGIPFAGFFLNNIKKHFDEVKNISKLKEDYQHMRNSTVSLVFEIQCYHNVKSGKNSTKKVVTHRAKKIIQLSQCYDFSGFMKPQIQKQFKKPYVFIDYSADYDFLQESQEAILENMYQNFIRQNTRDSYQDKSKTFKFADISEVTELGYLMQGQNTQIKTLLAIASALFLLWPLSMILELSYIQRYKVNVTKKIKLSEIQGGYNQAKAGQTGQVQSS